MVKRLYDKLRQKLFPVLYPEADANLQHLLKMREDSLKIEKDYRLLFDDYVKAVMELEKMKRAAGSHGGPAEEAANEN